MEGDNGDSRNTESESLAINATDTAFRVSQNGGLATFATQNQISNGAPQIQTTTSVNVLNPESRQDASKGSTRQDSISNVALTMTEVPGAVPQAVSSSSAVEDRGQVAVETTAGNVSGTVVIPQEYLAVATGQQAYVPTEPHNVNESVGLAVDEMDQDEKDRDDYNEVLREQDRFLPIANVARIMKKSIPKTGKIAKDAKECVQECVSEFISFITSEASERCHQEKRKTINGEDILFAMTTLGFDQYVEPLKIYLQKYRDSMKGEKGAMGSVGEGTELDDEGQNISHFSSGSMHPTMIAPEQANAIYGTAAYPSQIQQSLHFQSM